MRTTEDVRQYLEGTKYPAGPEDLLTTAKDNDAPPRFFELLGVLPTAAEFRSPQEVAEQLEHLQGLA